MRLSIRTRIQGRHFRLGSVGISGLRVNLQGF